MRRLNGVTNDEVSLEVGECDCGYHFGVDATYLEQVDDFTFPCPSCARLIDTADLFPEDEGPDEFYICQVCGKLCDAKTAHVNGDGWIGDECCWSTVSAQKV
jgi:hypothetical protein